MKDSSHPEKISAYVTDIQKFSLHDGAGIRTVVFLLGCPLRCKWCQNPETLFGHPKIMFSKDLCAGCGLCVKKCPGDAIFVNEEGFPETSPGLCEDCLSCARECYFKARTVSARKMTTDDVIKEVMKDEVFYKNSRGGITVSGGEPMMSFDFTLELLKNAKEHGLDTAMETCGHAPWVQYEAVLPYVDLFLHDFKIFDSQMHKKWTGADNRLIKNTLTGLSRKKAQVIYRIPLIPGVNDQPGEFESMMKFLKGLDNGDIIHILPFHQAGASKYKMVGAEYELKDMPEENDERIEHCRHCAERYGFRVNIGGEGLAAGSDEIQK